MTILFRYVELQNGHAASGVPGTTPFIHRDTNFFLLEDLRPDTEYRVDVYLIPVPLAEKELASDDVLTFRTKAKIPGIILLLLEVKRSTISSFIILHSPIK